MTVVVVVTPPSAVITTAEAKAHLRIDHDDDDVLVDALVATATAMLDGPDGWLGRAIGRQTLELRLGSFPYCDTDGRLPFPPLIEVESVKYTDSDGAEQTLDDESYRLFGEGTSTPRLAIAYGQSWPAIRSESESVRIRYIAGYAEVPAPLRQAILMMAGHLYENRETVSAVAMHEVPFAVEELAARYRIPNC